MLGIKLWLTDKDWALFLLEAWKGKGQSSSGSDICVTTATGIKLPRRLQVVDFKQGWRQLTWALPSWTGAKAASKMVTKNGTLCFFHVLSDVKAMFVYLPAKWHQTFHTSQAKFFTPAQINGKSIQQHYLLFSPAIYWCLTWNFCPLTVFWYPIAGKNLESICIKVWLYLSVRYIYFLTCYLIADKP